MLFRRIAKDNMQKDERESRAQHEPTRILNNS